ncbi:3-oxo-tetronate kinase [Thioclava atlantica]|uniref:3-oxo-tetronate kinase n=1 Tax=Thioclava atlantica TaxID=1317124 RepID=A0A085TZ90_9RHOB|nr:3-oxo-tetronate kinase [Thioclava atlantica]KFE36037.1 Hrp-dependent type III effector protein [Thioclava atlantica]
MLIGAVADDITGATDLCLMLSRAGLKTLQVIGLPVPEADIAEADAVVVALKSRTIPAAQAVAMSVQAAEALRAAGARQLMFKYCSTFDSTDEGNIGPVAEALMNFTGADLTIACPAFPATGRTVYKGHLFVGDRLLSESPLKDHPLTPMRDPDLVRVLGRQTDLPVGLVDIGTIRQGADAVRAAFDAARAHGQRILITDTLEEADLLTLGAACADMPLVTGGSGIGLGLAANFRDSAALRPAPDRMPAPEGRAAILAGSCSVATRGQIAKAQAAGLPSLAIDVAALAEGRQSAEAIADWAIAQPADSTPLIYSSADPEALSQVQSRLGREASGALVEDTLAAVAIRLRNAGVTRILIAGGETSGAVTAALGVQLLEIGPEIDPGVPWTRSLSDRPMVLALKSGNFGAPDFFLKAWDLLAPEAEHV